MDETIHRSCCQDTSLLVVPALVDNTKMLWRHLAAKMGTGHNSGSRQAILLSGLSNCCLFTAFSLVYVHGASVGILIRLGH